MVTVAAGLVVDLNSTSQGTTAQGFRRALAALFRQSAPGVASPGRLGTDHFVVSGSASAMEYKISGGGLVLVRTTTNGAYLVGVPDTQTVPTPPADGVNPRIDRIYARQPDPLLDGSAVAVSFVIDVAVGAAAASPVLPALPSGALELGRKLVAAGAVNTQSGAAFTDTAPVTGLNMGGLDVAQIPSLPASKTGTGIFPVERGGTGGGTKTDARTGLGFTSGTTAPSNANGQDGDIYFQIL